MNPNVTVVEVSLRHGFDPATFIQDCEGVKGVRHVGTAPRNTRLSQCRIRFECDTDATGGKLDRVLDRDERVNSWCIAWQRSGIV